MLRPFTTNQKACFDVERSGYYLFSGTSNGDFVVFDLRHEETVKLPIFTRKVAECAVSCVSVHECEPPLVALCTGERVFPKPEISSSHSSESESDQERMYSNGRHSRDFNNSLQLWAFDNET
nr:Telomerase Cajal body protein 1 [Haemonchus contortus]